MDAFDASPLCPAPTELQVDGVAYAAPGLVITARARRHVEVGGQRIGFGVRDKIKKA